MIALYWRAREAERICTLPWPVMAEVLGRLNTLLSG